MASSNASIEVARHGKAHVRRKPPAAHLARSLALLLVAGRQLDLVLVAGQQRVRRHHRQRVQQDVVGARDTLCSHIGLVEADTSTSYAWLSGGLHKLIHPC